MESLLSLAIKKEEARNAHQLEVYKRELEVLPNGGIQAKTIRGKRYFYLSYRDGKKVSSKYLGKNEDAVYEINELLLRRAQIEKIIKELELEKAKIKDMEDVI